MNMHTRLALLLLAASSASWAQGPAPAPSPAAPGTSAPGSSPAKKALVARLLEAQRPGLEALARTLAEQPAAQLMQQANGALQRVPADKREVVGREIEADLRKYVEEAVPIVRDRALKVAPTTMGPILEERLDEEELRQVVAALESPAFRKFQGMAGDLQRAFGQKLVADTRPAIEPKVKALEQSMIKRLGLTPPPAASAASGAKK